MAYLLKVEETYRVNSEQEAMTLIEDARHDERYELSKYSSVKRQLKQKGEIVDEWVRVTLTKAFDNEKEPMGGAGIEYTNGGAF